MKIETKFNLNDTVWFTYMGKPTKTEVCNFIIFVFNDGNIQERYHVLGYGGDLTQHQLFHTKAELLNSLV